VLPSRGSLALFFANAHGIACPNEARPRFHSLPHVVGHSTMVLPSRAFNKQVADESQSRHLQGSNFGVSVGRPWTP